ncbi:Phage repressor protein C, contains Cro/C1-type HTH and peptisase s24 domains [Pseudomonas sp. URIL14HWK12:I9]|nr:phage repressor protein C with HTH and peptisase S24 domain [Pseudomonas sp. URIL14HWK12:I12]PVZ27017.1 phage repressor protein C with HTH and peptisase S24 domain [Pseudomonas sp. URIL14HWK12:I10]PVZ37906.1 phage repressor protein C with HTH and peptisase S24 domain [Pseudomonas sp. URIL14HWK12:I11]SNZ05194.1 Phage repressor protein C, contains Cro/C1-type HTH and peptisase s24 domains [Pseudomonas sp. URIL14HWK12:I9]
MADQGITQADLARKTGVGQPTISRILKPTGPKGIKQPADKQVRPIADFFGITTDQLRGYEPLPKAPAVSVPQPSAPSAADVVMKMLAEHGRGLTDDARNKIAEAAAVTADIERANNVITVDFSRPGQMGDEVRIAHYDVRAAMGAGQIPHDYPEMLQDVRVSPKHLREMGITFEQHYHLKVITGWGESMTPTIRDRDPLLVDITIREFTGDGIYLFSHDEMLYVKRLQKKGKDRFRMISDNKHHEPEDIRVDDTHILARVLYVWNGHKV